MKILRICCCINILLCILSLYIGVCLLLFTDFIEEVSLGIIIASVIAIIATAAIYDRFKDKFN